MERDLQAKLVTILERLSAGRLRNARRKNALLLEQGMAVDDLLLAVRNSHLGRSVRAAAVRVVAMLGERRRAVPVLVSLLQSEDEDSQLRAEAAKALGFLASRRALQPLMMIVRDPDPELRKAATYALGLMRDPRAIQSIVGVLNNADEQPDVRGMAAEQLSWFSDSHVVESLVRALEDPSPEVRFWAIYSLGEIGGLDVLPALERVAGTDDAVRHPYGSLKDEATEAMAKIHSRHPNDALRP